MNNKDKQINDLIKSAKSYFGNDEKIYIYECTKCHKLDPVPSFIVNEQLGLLKFMKKKTSPNMDCPYCGETSIPIKTSD